MKVSSKSIFLVILCSILVAAAQIFLKIGADNFSNIFDPFIILGFVFYFLGMLSLMAALKNCSLNVIYPFVALSYVWVGLMAFYFLHEPIPSLHWLGIIFIVFGVGFIGAGNK